MKDIPDGMRLARFRCVVVVYDPSPAGGMFNAVGNVEGSIAHEPRGANGFGYDPVFVPTGSIRTTAEMSAREKDDISHRGRAIRAITSALKLHLNAI